jgi:hypothetical protein
MLFWPSQPGDDDHPLPDRRTEVMYQHRRKIDDETFIGRTLGSPQTGQNKLS